MFFFHRCCCCGCYFHRDGYRQHAVDGTRMTMSNWVFQKCDSSTQGLRGLSPCIHVAGLCMRYPSVWMNAFRLSNVRGHWTLREGGGEEDGRRFITFASGQEIALHKLAMINTFHVTGIGLVNECRHRQTSKCQRMQLLYQFKCVHQKISQLKYLNKQKKNAKKNYNFDRLSNQMKCDSESLSLRYPHCRTLAGLLCDPSFYP